MCMPSFDLLLYHFCIVFILFVYSAPGGGNAVNSGQVRVDKGLKRLKPEK